MHRLTQRKQRLLAGCVAAMAALGAGGGVALAVSGTTPPGTITVTDSGFGKTVTHVVTSAPPSITGATAEAAPPSQSAEILPPTTPLPISPLLLAPSNGWSQSNGADIVAVYAGSPPNDPATGRLVIVRQNDGTQKTTIVNTPNAGKLTITGPSETGAAEPTGVRSPVDTMVTFATSNGGSGTLDLRTNIATTSG